MPRIDILKNSALSALLMLGVISFMAEAQSAQPPATSQLSESDQLLLPDVIAACRDKNADSFVNNFVMLSEQVQRQFMAPIIERSVLQRAPSSQVIEKNSTKSENYHDFPIISEDYYYKPKHSVKADDEHEFLILDIKNSQTNQLIIGWTRIRFDYKNPDGGDLEGDDLGTAFTLDGKPYQEGVSHPDGRLVFNYLDGCWKLAADTRFPPLSTAQ